ncbi:MAG: hypothetical protein JO286_05575 [Solirubrobacterales bacterium]|nr:hypothetical protein [Solirubrobacterales bacterium]MBV9806631.1 hypothetical protein [Solirubrobacterales bacterium]
MPAASPPTAASQPGSTERIRRRVRLMVEISARPGGYRRGLEKAAELLTPQEAAVLADLEHHGLNVIQLRDVLRGAHVLVDDPSLYERWRFPKASHLRVSSHHHEIDKQKYPDIGMRGPLLREKLHGRTERGTWVQLEKTPAAFGKRKLPSWHDLVHLADYVMYRVTRSNIGPWGRSVDTEKRPMYLSPDLTARVPLPKAAADELTRVVSRLEESDDVTSASPELAARFAPPDRADDLRELTFTGEVQGRGLFAGSDVWVTRTAGETAKELLRRDVEPPGWRLPPVEASRRQTLELDDERTLVYALRTASPDTTEQE